MAKTRNSEPSHLTLIYKTFYVNYMIPKDVRGVIGKTVWRQTTGEQEEDKARLVAANIIAGVKRQIMLAREGRLPSQNALAEQLVATYREAEESTAQDRLALFNFAQHLLGRTKPALKAYTARVPSQDGLAFPPGTPEAEELAKMTGRAAATPFLRYYDGKEGWKASTNLRGKKSFDQAVSNINKFAAAHPDAMLETLTGGVVQKWIEERLMKEKNGHGNSDDPKTVRSRLSYLNNYWDWLRGRGYVPEERKSPFADRRVHDTRTGAEQAEDERVRWDRSEVIKLWRAAMAQSNQPLADTIMIAAFTGARREGITSAKVNSVRTDEDTGIRYLHLVEKTRNGVRDVPVHPAISGLIDTLINNADADGYLIRSRRDKYGKRGDRIGKDFTKLKQELGFGTQKVFHCFRHLVIHLLQRANCENILLQKLMGHSATGQNGRYGGQVDLPTALAWFSKSVTYPAFEAQDGAVAAVKMGSRGRTKAPEWR